jgi:hypothetical protein
MTETQTFDPSAAAEQLERLELQFCGDRAAVVFNPPLNVRAGGEGRVALSWRQFGGYPGANPDPSGRSD